MHFERSEEQRMLSDLLSRYLAEHYSFEQRMRAVGSTEGWRPECWQTLANQLGILAAAFPESYGGLGGGALENQIVMQAFGHALVLEPYLGTVVIGGGLLKRVGGELAEALIPRIIAGEVRIACAHGERQSRYCLHDIKTRASASPDGAGHGYVLNGHKTAVMAAPNATHLLVTARTAGEQRDLDGVSLLLIDKLSPGVRCQDYPTVDGGRAADVWFDNVAVSADAVIGQAGDGLLLLEHVFDEALVALCAEAVGGMQKMLADTLAYARERKQFGVSIGSLQVLQHRMVDMHIHIEQSQALTHVASLKLAAPARERAMAASAAKVRVGKALKFVGQAAVQIHGGMGITEELAVGHYFKRATVIEQQLGSVDHHLRRYGELAAGATHAEHGNETCVDQQQFCKEVQDWIAQAFDPGLQEMMRQSKNGFLDKEGQRRWQQKLHQRGWAAPDWPTEYGGPGWTPSQRMLFQREISAAGCPPVSPMGLKMVAPVIMRFGTEAQKTRFLPPTLASEIFWCQGYSEPGAGSDLASLQMKAERDGDHYVLNGSKIWTTHAQWADWMFCLVRTSRETRKQDGISFLLLDMTTPGITVTSVPLLDGPVPGEQEVNQVFFENVRVPVSNRVGEEGQGWTCAKYLLEFERGGAYGPSLRYQLNALKEIAAQESADDGGRLLQAADFRRKLFDLEIQVEAVDATERLIFSGIRSGTSVGSASSMIKLAGTETKQAISELAVEAVGPQGWAFIRDTWAECQGRPAHARPGPSYLGVVLPRYFNYRKTSIYGGTSEVQRNIIARHVLGL